VTSILSTPTAYTSPGERTPLFDLQAGDYKKPRQSRQSNAGSVAEFILPKREPHSAAPKAALTMITLIGLIYTASISGGYGLESSVKAGGPLLSIVALCLIPIVWGVPVSLCVAELACAMPSNAGPIMWVNCSFKPWLTMSFVVWTLLLNWVDNSLYPTVFAEYAATVLDLDESWTAVAKVAFLWICALINIFGVEIVGLFSIIIMIITVAPFLLLFMYQLPHGFDWERIASIPEHVNWSLFLPVVAWNFSGFDSAGHIVEEVADPGKTFVGALIWTSVAGLLTYIPPIMVGASAAGLKHLPWSKWGNGFWITVGNAVGGKHIGAIVMLGGGLSTFGLMTTLLATTSRSLAGIGTLNAFPAPISRWLARYNHYTNTPVNAIIVNTTVTSILAVMLTFDVLVALDSVLYSIRLILILLCFLKLRFHWPSLKRPYRAPVKGALPTITLAMVPLLVSVFLLSVGMMQSQKTLMATIVTVFGVAGASSILMRYWRSEGFEGRLEEIEQDHELSHHNYQIHHGLRI